MNFLRKIKSVFHDDWCSNCQITMEVGNKKLFMLPMLVGHYQSHSKADYYIKNIAFL